MILATRHGNIVVQTREANLGAMITAAGGSLRGSSGLSATREDVAGLPAWQQGIRIASEAIAKHELCVWRGPEAERRKVDTTWQAKFFSGQPNDREPWFLVWEQTEASLTSRNNAFWLKLSSGGRVEEVHVLHPDGVECRWNSVERRAEYRLQLERGISKWLTSADVLHFRKGAPAPGQVVTPSPLEIHRTTFASAIARSKAEENHYSGGVMKSVAVVFPGTVTPEQADRWKQVYMGPGGVDTDSQVKVFGGDPRIETIGLSLQDSQYVEAMGFSIYDVGRILGVPPSLLWAATASGDKPITPEHEEDRWWRYGLTPRRMRIEKTVAHDPSFFGAGAQDYPMFTSNAVRADRATEATRVKELVQAGVIVPDTGAAELGYPPLPNGLGQIPQITPVGGAPNAAAAPQQATRELVVVNMPADDQHAVEIRDAVREMGRAARDQKPPVVQNDIHVPAPEPTPVVIENTVSVPDQRAPVVNVENVVQVPEQRDAPAPVVQVTNVVEPTPVTVENTVNVPQGPAPVVNVDSGPKKITLDRTNMGQLKGATIEDAD